MAPKRRESRFQTPSNPATPTPVSRVDEHVYGLWVKLLFLFFIMFVLSAVVPVVAMFPNYGYPCYYNALVNYSAINLTQRNAAKHLTPALFLEAPEMMFYITLSFAVDCYSAVYYFLSACALRRARRFHVSTVTSLQSWVALVGSPLLVFLSIIRLFTIQLFVDTLSFKNIFLACFVYAVHFFLSFFHIQSYISRNSARWAVVMLEQHIPSNSLVEHVLQYWKPIGANLFLFLLAVEALVFSLSFMLAIGNSFYILVSDAVFGAVNLYLGLTVLWYFITELFLARYLPFQFGFYLGVFASAVILTLPLVRYESIFVAAKLHQAVAINIGVLAALAAFALAIRVLRIWRAPTGAVLYGPLQEPRRAPRAEFKRRRVGNQAQGPAVMESDSEEEVDILFN